MSPNRTFPELSMGPGFLEGLFMVADILDVGMIAVDRDLRVIRCNHWITAACAPIVGEGLQGAKLTEIFPEFAGTPQENAFRRAVEGETVVLAQKFHHYLLPIPCIPAVEEFPLMQQSARIVPILDGDRVTGAVAIVQDVTERAVRETELRIARDAAESASRAKSQFLAAMSHELRTPLTAVIGYAELLAHGVGGQLSPLHKQHAERISASAWHLIGIIDEVLTFSRAEAGREELLIAPVDLCDCARAALSIVEPQAMAKGLDIVMRTECDRMMFDTDQLRIQQILINLLGNAVKFTEQGQIDLRMRWEGADVVISVRDSGPGVPAESQQGIFEAFTQVDQTATRSKGGTGLGLPVSRKLAELLGGTLVLEESSAAGSTFTLRLPARDSQATLSE